MKEKIKNNIYSLVVILTILAAVFIVIIKEVEEYPIILFFLVTSFFLAIVWFFSQDKQIKEFKTTFNEKFPLLGKALAVIFRIFVFLVFLLSIFIVVAGIMAHLEEIKMGKIKLEQQEQQRLDITEEKFVQLGNDSVKQGDILWKVSNVINRGKRLDSRYTEGKFIEIWIEVENLSPVAKPLRIVSDKIKLIDDQKREFPLSKGEEMRPESQLFEGLFWQTFTLKPGIPTGFKLFFEVAEDSTNYLINLYYE